MQYLRESSNLATPQIVKLVEQDQLVGLRVYSYHNIVDFSLEQVKGISKYIKNLPVVEVVNGKSELQEQGFVFCLTHDCLVEVRNFKPVVLQNQSEERVRQLKKYLRTNKEGGYFVEEEVLNYPESLGSQSRVNVKLVNRWVSTENLVTNLFTRNDFEETSEMYEKLLVSEFIINRTLENHTVVKTFYGNKLEEGGYALHSDYVNVITTELARKYQTEKGLYKAILKLTEKEGD